ncbi:SLC45 family MFS transporter [Paenibacillus harenae]|uniref:SLC45 family MFS transporter n=1 Tax=Paenibacillus harenae TaxID=306543 RepID=UPI00279009ED|nr:SLC45 family MFS transporter [Paenibacillus harenae]MDQ0060151.1 Na+/melibiose symporter-like transporter [Paenibacillus harenae]
MRKTWLLGFGFFSISITWALYNAFVPFFLDNYLSSTLLIGFMMTIDNYFALFLQPWVGNLSDKTNTRFGKRLPYLMIGMPLAALFVALVPFHVSLVTLVAFMVLMNLSMSVYRSPTVALMPDITIDSKRSQANGIINFMGGIGALLAFFVGSKLYDADHSLPFLSAAVITIISLGILMFVIKEKRDTVAYIPAEQREKLSFRSELNRSTVFLLGAIFFWFLSYQGVEALFTLYGENHLGLTEGQSAFSLGFFSLALVLAAIPSGLLGRRFGKKRIIMIGVSGLVVIFAAITFIDALLPLRLLMLAGGIFWAMININSYPFIIGLGKEQSIGRRTGIYYVFSSLAAIASPPLMGGLIDLFGYSILFYVASGSMLIALAFLFGVRDKGLARDTTATGHSTTA